MIITQSNQLPAEISVFIAFPTSFLPSFLQVGDSGSIVFGDTAPAEVIASHSTVGAITVASFFAIWILILYLLWNNSSWVASERKLLGIINQLQTSEVLNKKTFKVLGIFATNIV